MPWCPNCKAEYQEGFTECSDCGVPLVDSIEKEIEYVPFFQAEEAKFAEKLARYLEYSGVKTQVTYDGENELYLVSIPPKAEKQAKKLYQAFIFVERENIENGVYDKNKTDVPSDAEKDTLKENTPGHNAADPGEASEADGPTVEYYDEELYQEDTPSDEEEEDRNSFDSDGEITKGEAEEDSSVYVMKADKYKDLAGTVWIFLFFGVIGLVFVLLNMAGILSVLNGWMPNLIMLAMFLFFLYVAASTNAKAKKIRAEIDAENKMTEDINQWFEAHFTEEFLSSIHNDNISSELNYMKMTDIMKEMLIKEFGPLNLAYLDRLIEEYYSRNFDHIVE